MRAMSASARASGHSLEQRITTVVRHESHDRLGRLLVRNRCFGYVIFLHSMLLASALSSSCLRLVVCSLFQRSIHLTPALAARFGSLLLHMTCVSDDVASAVTLLSCGVDPLSPDIGDV